MSVWRFLRRRAGLSSSSFPPSATWTDDPTHIETRERRKKAKVRGERGPGRGREELS